MSPPEPESNERAQRAAKIIAKPAHYKVCEQCDSIVTKKAVHCPNCHGYRFNAEPSAVIAQAQKLAAHAQTSVTSEDLH